MHRNLYLFLLIAALPCAGQPITCDFQTNAEVCYTANGMVLAQVAGGTPPYTYQWSPEPPNGQGTEQISGLSAGFYELTVTDNVGTQQLFMAEVVADLSLGWTGAGTYAGAHAYTGFGVPCEGQCNGAMAMPNPPMIPGPFFYTWSDPSITEVFTTPQGDPVFFGFCADQSYSYTINNLSGCSSTSLPFNNPVVLDAAYWAVAGTVPASCGNSDGSITLTQASPWPADMVLTDAGGALVLEDNTGQGSYTINDLPAGAYTAVFNYGSSNCSSTMNFSITEAGNGCGSVAGMLFLDTDADCTIDGGEPGIPYRTLQVDPGAQLVITNANGSFVGGLSDGSYTLSVLDATVTPACPQAQPIPFNVNGSVSTLDIGAGSTSPMDLVVSAVSNTARPGFAHTVWAEVMNNGAQPSDPVDVTCTLDPSLAYLSAVPAPTSVNGNTVTWSLPALSAFGIASVQLITQVNNSTQLGEVIDVAFTAVNNGAEANTANNSCTASRTVSGSYDPNDKTAFTSTRQSATEYVLGQDAWIDYVIRFQNTGTDTAFTVVVVDTLGTDLDMATYAQGTASHPFTVHFKPGRVVEWRFANILLPDSNTNEPLSHGAVGFRIRPTQAVAAGTILSNAADIFFDFNTPIRTNTSELVATLSTGMRPAPAPHVQLYPNPNQGTFALAVEGDALMEINVFAPDARRVLQQRASGSRSQVSLPGLAPGVYLAEVRTAGGRTLLERIMVQ